MAFEILEHTADIRLLVKGKNLEELFKEALKGMAFIQKSNIRNSMLAGRQEVSKNKRLIEIQSPDKTALLVDFLSEALVQSQINKEVYADVKFLEFSEINPEAVPQNAGRYGARLKAEIYGNPVESFDEDIKAVTYHEAEIKQNEKGEWETMLIFDI